jgi:hypothetical protein
MILASIVLGRWETEMQATAVSMSTVRVSDALLLIGVVLFASGLGVFTGGLRSPHGSPPIIDSAAQSRGIAEHDRAAYARLPRLGDSAPIPTEPTTTDDHPLGAVPRRPERSFSADSLGNLDGVAMERAAARWSTDWYRVTLVDDGTRGYLARSANAQRGARWYRSLMGWEDVTGYGAVGASRAAQNEVTGVVATIPANRGAG